MIPKLKVGEIRVRQDGFGVTIFSNSQHRAPDLPRCGDLPRHQALKNRNNGRKRDIEDAIEFGFRLNSIERPNKSRAKNISAAKPHTENGIFRAALHARPHHSPLFGRVRSSARNKNKNHRRIFLHQHASSGNSNTVGDFRIRLFGHPGRRDSETKEASVKSRELNRNGGEILKIAVNNFAKLRIAASGRRSNDRHNASDVCIAQTLEQHALTDHSRCAKQNDFHIQVTALTNVSIEDRKFIIARRARRERVGKFRPDLPSDTAIAHPTTGHSAVPGELDSPIKSSEIFQFANR